MPFSDPEQLGAVILAARQRLGCVISSGPTIQLGSVIYLARLRLGRVILALTLPHTADQRVFSIGPTQLGSVIAAVRLRLGRVMFQSPQSDSSLCTSTFITPKEARRVRHEKLVNAKMESSLNPDDYVHVNLICI